MRHRGGSSAAAGALTAQLPGSWTRGDGDSPALGSGRAECAILQHSKLGNVQDSRHTLRERAHRPLQSRPEAQAETVHSESHGWRKVPGVGWEGESESRAKLRSSLTLRLEVQKGQRGR